MAEILHITKDRLDAEFLENLHSTVFDFVKPGEDFRIDGCYVSKEDDDTFSGYVIYKELSSSVVELCYGAAEKTHRGFLSLKNLTHFIGLMFDKYEIITTEVSNKNYKMLRIYMALGFDVVGIRKSYTGTILVLLQKIKE